MLLSLIYNEQLQSYMYVSCVTVICLAKTTYVKLVTYIQLPVCDFDGIYRENKSKCATTVYVFFTLILCP